MRLLSRSRLTVIVVLAALIGIAFYLRTFALWRDFVFVYDQGRDALEVTKILHGNLTLVGPTTGLFGVFLGPFWYYFLAPFYLFGQGNPMVAAYGIAAIASLAIIPLYIYAAKTGGKLAGFIAAFLYVISFSQIMFARWLSNPSPLPITSLILFLSVIKAVNSRQKRWFFWVGILLGLSVQMEAANAVFFIPTLVIIGITELKLWIWPISKLKQSILSTRSFWGALLIGFVILLVPQGVFELRHKFTSTRALIRSFQVRDTTVSRNIPVRIEKLVELYGKGLFPSQEAIILPFMAAVIILGIKERKQLWKNLPFRVAFWWFVIPFMGDLFYSGNHGNFWDYYIIAQHNALYILIAAVLAVGIKARKISSVISWALLLVLVLLGLSTNLKSWRGFLTPYDKRISLSLQLEAINWMEADAAGQPFGEWAYTPSLQDDVYRYLISYTAKRTGVMPVEHPEHTPLMYFIVEDDPGREKLRQEWITEKSAIGRIEYSKSFGAVTVFRVKRT